MANDKDISKPQKNAGHYKGKKRIKIKNLCFSGYACIRNSSKK